MDIFEHSHWLWNYRCQGMQNVYLDFYENFQIDTPAAVYTLYISADADYAVYVNGSLAAFGQYADYEFYKVYDTVDLTSYITAGENEIKVTVYAPGTHFSTYRMGQPGVIYALYAGEDLFIISSDETKMAINPCYQAGAMETVSGQLGYTFSYDAVKEGQKPDLRRAEGVEKSKTRYPRPIKKLTFEDCQAAEVRAQGIFMDTRVEGLSIGRRVSNAFLSTRELHAMTGAEDKKALPTQEGITFHGERFDTAADGVFVLVDLKKESTGVFMLDIDLPKDTEILVGWGEHLDDLRTRSAIGSRNFAFRVRMRKGRSIFVAPFLRLGLRYLQLHIYAEQCTLYYAGIRPTYYPLSDAPFFSCADHLHNRIYEVCKHTLKLCMHEHYEDCPWREQALYAMDSRNQMLCGYYAFGETAFARESIRLMSMSLRKDGLLELCSPAYVSITIPSFTAIFVVQLEEYLRYSGDTAFVQALMPTVHAIMEAFHRRTDTPCGLLKCYGEEKYWNFYEWQEGLEGSIGGDVPEEARTYDAPLNAFYSMALRSAALLEEAFGETDAAAAYREEKRGLDNKMHALFWEETEGIYLSFVKGEGEAAKRYHRAELTNALMVYADICPARCEDRVLSALAEKKLLPITLSHSIFKYEALLRRPDRYAKGVFAEIADIWGGMLYQGATSFYETEEGAPAFGGAGSLCHGWSAIPLYLYYAYVLGLKPTGIGYASYDIKPLDTGIYEAKGMAVTPVGEINL